MRTRVIVLAVVGCLVAGGATLYLSGLFNKPDGPGGPGPEPEDRPGWFSDVTDRSGVDFTYQNGEEAGHYAILESLGGGVALIDYDGDRLLDLYLPGGGRFGKSLRDYVEFKDGKPVLKNEQFVPKSSPPSILGRASRLYRNRGDFRFEDVTERAGLAGPGFYTHGAAVADYDRDGWPDLLVTGYGRVVLYRNEPAEPGGRRFRDVTAAAGLDLGKHFWATSAAFGDLDGDGFPDLYLCQYVDWSWQNNPPCNGYTTDVERDVCSPRQFRSVPHRLFHNLGRSGGGPVRFQDVSAEAGLRVGPGENAEFCGKGLGVLIVDVNGDGKPDVYVANDTTDNFLYVNASRPGKIVLGERGAFALCARDGSGTPNGSMGVDAADYDGSGRPSIWVTNYEGELHALYRNTSRGGRPLFRFSTQTAGIAAIGQNFVGFGTAFVDVDADGWEDLVVSNGHVIRHPHRAGLRQKAVLLKNLGDGRFAEVGARGGPYFRQEHRGRGLAVGDLDNDGRPDLVISHVNEPVALLRHSGTPQRWIGFRLLGAGGADVAGARLSLKAGGRTLVRYVKGGGSYLSASDPRLLVGLSDQEQVDEVKVEWPSGEPRVQTFGPLAAGRYWVLPQAGVPRSEAR